MKKISIMAAAAALTVATAAPVFAETKAQNDPFVSTQGSLALGAGGAGAAAIAAVTLAILIAASDGT